MSSGNSVARPLREEGNNPFQNENKKLMFVLPKLLSPFQQKHAKQNSCHTFYTQNWILFYSYAICNFP
jgi:hypothetical protein